MNDEILYMLALAADVAEDAWRTRLGWTAAFVGAKSTKFINLFTDEQLASAAEASFAGKADLMLLSFNVESMREEADLKVKFEAAESTSGGAGAFVHVYGGPIPYACLHAPPLLLTLTDGKHVFPLMGAAAAEAALLQQNVYESDDNPSDDDGLPQFDQHMYDLDDDDNDCLDPR